MVDYCAIRSTGAAMWTINASMSSLLITVSSTTCRECRNQDPFSLNFYIYIYINGHVTTRQARDKHRARKVVKNASTTYLQARYGRLGVSIIELTQPLLCLEVFELELRGLLRAKSASASASASKQQVNRFMSKSVSPSG